MSMDDYIDFSSQTAIMIGLFSFLFSKGKTSKVILFERLHSGSCLHVDDKPIKPSAFFYHYHRLLTHSCLKWSKTSRRWWFSFTQSSFFLHMEHFNAVFISKSTQKNLLLFDSKFFSVFFYSFHRQFAAAEYDTKFCTLNSLLLGLFVSETSAFGAWRAPSQAPPARSSSLLLLWHGKRSGWV